MNDAKVVFDPLCSAASIWAVKKEIVDDLEDFMLETYDHIDSHTFGDFVKVWKQDKARLNRFEQSAIYKNWVANRSEADISEMKF